MPEPLKSTLDIWRTMGGDNSRRGRSSSPLSVSMKLISHWEAQGGIAASPICNQEGAVFLADMAGKVHAYSPTGKSLWKRALDGGIHATPVLDDQDSRLFVGTLGGTLYALNPQNGEKIWQQSLGGKSDPRIVADLLYLPKSQLLIASSWNEKYVAVDAASGAPKYSWSAGFAPQAAASAAADETVYALRAETARPPKEPVGAIKLVQWNPQNGEEQVIFSQPLPEDKAGSRMLAVLAAPVLDAPRKRIYLITNLDRTGILVAFSLESKTKIWEHAFSRNIYGTPTLLEDGSVTVTDLNGDVTGFSANGESRWRYPSGAYYLTGAPVCNQEGWIAVGDPEGKIHLISPQGIGTPIFEAERAIQARPVFDASRNLLVPSMDGKVYIFAA